MSLHLCEKEFIEKYGFAINDLYYSCIYNILNTRYACYTVKDVAYDIAYKVYSELYTCNNEVELLYKLDDDPVIDSKKAIYNIAFKYKDFYFTFEIYRGSQLYKPMFWDLQPEDIIEKDESYVDIEEVIKEEEEEL